MLRPRAPRLCLRRLRPKPASAWRSCRRRERKSTCAQKNAAGGLNSTFREPVAALLEEGKTVGRHFVGPTWEFVDGSRVEGEVVTKAPGKTAKDIPWLKLSVKESPKSGLVAGATSILRIDTKGGVFEGACDNEGELHSEPYAATYVFVK